MFFRKRCIHSGWAKPGVSNSTFLMGEAFLMPFGMVTTRTQPAPCKAASVDPQAGKGVLPREQEGFL